MGFDYNFDRDEPKILIPAANKRRRWVLAVIFTLILFFILYLLSPSKALPEEGEGPVKPVTQGTTQTDDKPDTPGIYPKEDADIFAEARRNIENNPSKALGMAYQLLAKYEVGSQAWKHAADVVGEANLNIMMNKLPNDKNQVYTVVSGDTLSRIASKNKTTAALIMKVNQVDGSIIRPGQKFTIYQGDWKVNLLKNSKLALVYDGDVLFKAYPFTAGSLPVGEKWTSFRDKLGLSDADKAELALYVLGSVPVTVSE